MPRYDDKIALYHMMDHAREAMDMIAEKAPADLGQDRMLELALVRLVEIIGEAAGRVSQNTQEEYPEIPWREVYRHAEPSDSRLR